MFSQQTSRARSDVLADDSAEAASWVESAASRQNVRTAYARVRSHEWTTAFLLLVCDIASWIAVYGFVGFARRDKFFVDPFEFVLVDCVVVAVIIQSIYIIGGYNRNTEMRGLTYTTEHILAVAAAAAVSALILYSAATFDESMKPSRGVLLVSFVVFLPISILYRRMVRQRIAASTAQRTFLVIGSGELAARFYDTYKKSANQQKLEFVDNDSARVGAHISGPESPIVQNGIADKLAQLDRRYSGVILAESVDRLSQELIERLVRTQFQRTRVYTLESFYEANWRHVPMHTIDPFWPLQMGFQLARISPYHYLKRLCDVVLSGVLLVISFPFMLLAGFVVWITGGSPIIFRQDRIGREGEVFTAYKFRTMAQRDGAAQLSVNGSPLSVEQGEDGGAAGGTVQGAGSSIVAQRSEVGGRRSQVRDQRSEDRGQAAAEIEEGDDLYTRADDPRVTSVGRWLRKVRLDELPQLWNVFRGDMSLIGPRAEWTKCAERYETKIPFYHFRHLVKPGITGWAQVNYPYGESDQDAIEKLQYDLYYIRHYSLKLDAMIVLKTVHTMLFGKGQ